MRTRQRKRPMAEINVVPYIDVMLVLLIIFMVTTPLLTQGVEINLPKVASKQIASNNKPPVLVSVDKAGDLYLNYGEDKDKPLDPQTLVHRMTALLIYQPGIKVLIEGDSEVAYGRVVEIMSLLQGAGVENVGMLTSPPER